MTEKEFSEGKDLSEEEIKLFTGKIIEYCMFQTGYSYYDLKKYIYDNDLYEWIICLKKREIRNLISTLLKDKLRKEKVGYKRDFAKAVTEAEQAAADFYERHNFDEINIRSLEGEE